MITAFSRFRLPPGLNREQILADIQHSLPMYKGRDGLIRKYICIDIEQGVGTGVYLWNDRAKAEAFFAIARAKIKEQTGSEPEISYMDTPVVVDNLTGEVAID